MRDRSAFLVVIVGTFGLQGLTMVTGIITARLLGADGRGQVALVFALGLMASQLTFGGSLPNAITKNLAERRLGARDGLGRIARRRAPLLLVPSLVAGGLMLVIAETDATGDRLALAVAVVIMALQTMGFRVLLACLQGEVGNLARMAVVAILPQACFTIVLVTVAIAGWKWEALDVLATFLVVSLVGFVAGARSLAPPTRQPDSELDEGELWAVTRTTYVSSVRPVDGLGLDRVLIGAIAGNVALGLYAAAIAVANLCGTVCNAISVIVLPQVALHTGDDASQLRVTKRWLLLAGVVVTLVALVLEAIVSPLIRIAFGDEFVPAIEPARWLILADALYGFRRVLIAVLQARGKGGTASWIELAVTPLLVLGIVLAAGRDDLTLVAITMAGVAAVACAALAAAVTLDFRATRGSRVVDQAA